MEEAESIQVRLLRSRFQIHLKKLSVLLKLKASKDSGVKMAEVEFKCKLCGKRSTISELQPRIQYSNELLVHCPLCGHKWHIPTGDYFPEFGRIGPLIEEQQGIGMAMKNQASKEEAEQFHKAYSEVRITNVAASSVAAMKILNGYLGRDERREFLEWLLEFFPQEVKSFMEVHK